MRIKSLIVTVFSLSIIIPGFAQTNGSTIYKLETSGTISSGETTPFWLVSNRYGVVPLESGNGLIRAGVFHNQKSGNDFRWTAGIDIAGVTPRQHKLFVQQFYAELGYKAICLSAGSKERYNSIVDKRLSSGDMVLSPNARPIPEINFSIPEFAVVPYTKGLLQVKGDFAVGKSFDKGYLNDFTSVSIKEIIYIDHVLWHHKSAFLRIEDTRNDFPLFGTIGLEHWAQWGGTSTNPKIGRQPQSIKDFWRVVFGKEGGEGATVSDSINVLGNHYGSFYFSLGYKIKDFGTLQAYHQHYFDDKSGMEFFNKLDGLWGLEVETNKLPWLKKIVVELITTKDQSGPFHFITFDHDKHPGRGGGSDNYYNNGEYTTGVSYFNRAIGSPLILSPEYNPTHEIGFRNNRINGLHLGAEGDISPQVSYRLLATKITGWGTAYKPFLNTKTSVTTLVEINYTHPRLAGWQFRGALAFDTGSIVEKNTGFTLSIRKQGILRSW